MWHHGFMQGINNGGCFGGGSFMMIGWVLIIGLGLYFILKSKKETVSAVDPSEDLLRMRFAKGEIDEKEYEERITALRKK